MSKVRSEDHSLRSVNSDEKKRIECEILDLIQNLDKSQKAKVEYLTFASDDPRPWTSIDVQAIQEHYNTLAKAFPSNIPKTGDWGNETEQLLVMEDLLQLFEPKGLRILDLGCGSGFFLRTMHSSNQLPLDYIGVDASPDIIQIAQKHFPKNTFHCFDVFQASAWPDHILNQSFDIVLACGLYGIRPKTWSVAEFNRLILDHIGFVLDRFRCDFVFNVIPYNYPILHKILELKPDNEVSAYHRVDRIAFCAALERRDLHLRTLSPVLHRLMAQFPVRVSRPR